MSIKSSFFKLDSNIDGTYKDENGEVVTIPNMIQVVGAADGSVGYSNKLGEFDISESELEEIIDLENQVNNSGHGILYDSSGKAYAFKGDLVFRDGNGNQGTLSTLINKINSVSVEGNNVFLRDKTLQQYNTSNKGVLLNDILDNVLFKSGVLGVGNIVFAARAEDVNASTVSVFTNRISNNSYIWITGSAMVNKPTTIQVRDVTANANVVLDISRIDPNGNNYMPVFVSYFGKVAEVSAGVDQDTCDPYIWNSYLKRFFTKSAQSKQTTFIHEIALEIYDGEEDDVFERGNINVVCVDLEKDQDVIYSGFKYLNDEFSTDVSFDELEDSDYSVSFQHSGNEQCWYTNKETSGFTINFERSYTGVVYWLVVKNL